MAGAAEGGAGDQGDFGFGEQGFRQFDVVVQAHFFHHAVEAGEYIKGAVAGQAADAVDGIQRPVDEVMALFEGFVHFLEARLVAFQRRLGRHLGNGGGVGGALRLDLFHRLDDIRRAAGVTDAPAGHGIGLGDAVEHECAVIEGRAGVDDVAEGLLGPEDMFIHIIGGDQDVGIFQQHVPQGLELGHAVGLAGGVGGAVDDEQPGFVGDGGFELLGGDLEGLGLVALDDHRFAVRQHDHIGIGHPVGGGDDDFVTGVEQSLGQVEKALFATT